MDEQPSASMSIQCVSKMTKKEETKYRVLGARGRAIGHSSGDASQVPPTAIGIMLGFP